MIGRNNVDLEIDGSPEQSDELCRRLDSLPEVSGFNRQGDYLTIRFAPPRSWPRLPADC